MLWIATDMADKRKLQGEIERCLKKVTEGVETFEDIWLKIHAASNANQKEKYEADLKKEIKKLQRLRDQIKTWLTSSDIKDKSILQENRRLIETQMERFKVVERETKTKAYSKEGLGAAQKLDPAQKEKDDVANWLTESINTLSIQVDQYESELELLGSVTKKKKGSKDKTHRVEELKTWLSKHRYHINQLETLLRMLDNSTIEVNQVKKVKDDVNHYIDASQDADFQENAYIYDDLNLDDFEAYLTGQKTGNNSDGDVKVPAETEEVNTALSSMSTSTNSSSSACNSGLTYHSNDCESDSPTKSLISKSNHVNNPSNSANIKSLPTSKSTSLTLTSSSNVTSCQVLNSHNAVTSLPVPDVIPSVETLKNIVCQQTALSAPENCQLLNCDRSEKSSETNLSSANFPKIQNNFSTHITQSQDLSSVVDHPVRSQLTIENPKCYQPASTITVSNMNAESRSSSEELHNSVADSEANSTATSTCQTQLAELAISPSDVENAEELNSLLYNVQHTLLNGELESQHHITNSGNSAANTPVEPAQSSTPSPPPPFKMIKMPVSPILGYYPLGNSNILQETVTQMRRLEMSNKRLPQPMDSEKLRRSLARTPCSVPEYYKLQLPSCDSFDFFQHLSTETLFFIFYYMEGSKAQYLAAKTLKKQSWRFHTRYMLWFQRHEEPKTITDEFEQGTYIYFDFERWSQRKKDGFTFEYRFLEDQDLN